MKIDLKYIKWRDCVAHSKKWKDINALESELSINESVGWKISEHDEHSVYAAQSHVVHITDDEHEIHYSDRFCIPKSCIIYERILHGSENNRVTDICMISYSDAMFLNSGSQLATYDHRQDIDCLEFAGFVTKSSDQILSLITNKNDLDKISAGGMLVGKKEIIRIRYMS